VKTLKKFQPDISAAILTYEGVGRSPFPLSDSQGVIAQFGAKSTVLLEEIAAIGREMDDLRPDWSKETLIGATKRMGATIKGLHPELDDAAVKALEWGYSYGWK
jgi:hypothetical protein